MRLSCSTNLIHPVRSSGHVAPAHELTEEIIAFATAHDESVYLPELLRLRGELREGADPAAAAGDYRRAIELARATGARGLERRATDSLAALTAGTR